MRARFKEILFVTVIAGAAATAGAIYYPYSKAAAMHRSLKQAGEHVRMLAPQLQNDTRFDGVQITEYMEGGGTILIRGTVETNADLDALHRVIDASQPPVSVRWSVDALEAPATRQLPM